MHCQLMLNRTIFAAVVLTMSACSSGIKEVSDKPLVDSAADEISNTTTDEITTSTAEEVVADNSSAANTRLPIPKPANTRLAIPKPASPELSVANKGLIPAPINSAIVAPDAVGTQALRTGRIDSLREAVNSNRSEPPRAPQAEQLNITLTTLRAERGDLESQVALGKAYAYGTPRLEKDPAQARAWLELAALKGDDEAQYELGSLFYSGSGVDLDYFNAREWWIESALQGNLDAQQKLGYLYSEGLGVDQDYGKAKDWYLRAAQRGHAEAQTLLGSLYHEGNRIPHDFNEAFKWYKLAAEQGHAHAQYTVATLYHDGRGTQVDYILCAAWVDVAIANGFDDEFDAKGNCRGQLDDLSNLTATHLANTWKKRYLSDDL